MAHFAANSAAGMRLLTQDPIDATTLREILVDIAEENQQASNVIGRLRSFLKEGVTHSEPVPIGTVVRDALALSHSTIALSAVRSDERCVSGGTAAPGCVSGARTTPVAVRRSISSCPLNSRHRPKRSGDSWHATCRPPVRKMHPRTALFRASAIALFMVSAFWPAAACAQDDGDEIANEYRFTLLTSHSTDRDVIDPVRLRAGLAYVVNDRVRVEFIYHAQYTHPEGSSLHYTDNIFRLNVKLGRLHGIVGRVHDPE
jgi:hypothetical protein